MGTAGVASIVRYGGKIPRMKMPKNTGPVAVIAWSAAAVVASYAVTTVLRPQFIATGADIWWSLMFAVSVLALAVWSWFTLSEHAEALQGAAMSTVQWQRLAVAAAQLAAGLLYFGSVAWYVARHEGWMR